MMKTVKRIPLWPWLIALVITVFLVTGCATVYKKPGDAVSFRSHPAGAEVYVNGRCMGRTPLKIRLESGSRYYVEFIKDGYETRTLKLENRIGPGWILFNIAGGLVPESIHTAIGDWHYRRQVMVIAELIRKSCIYQKY